MNEGEKAAASQVESTSASSLLVAPSLDLKISSSSSDQTDQKHSLLATPSSDQTDEKDVQRLNNQNIDVCAICGDEGELLCWFCFVAFLFSRCSSSDRFPV
jgi:hypothetical protein